MTELQIILLIIFNSLQKYLSKNFFTAFIIRMFLEMQEKRNVIRL